MMTKFDCALLAACEGGGIPECTDAALFAMLQVAMTLADVADKLGISIRQVQNHVDDGALVAVNLGRGSVRKDLRVLDADLQGFLVRRRTCAVKVATFQDARDARPKPLGENPTYAERRASRKNRPPCRTPDPGARPDPQS